MKKLFLFSFVAVSFFILGAGCVFKTFHNKSKIDKEELDRIKSNSSSVTPHAGPFAYVKFSFYGREPGGGISAMDTPTNTYRVNMYTAPSSATTSIPILSAFGEVMPLDQVLSEAPQGNIIYSHRFNNKIIDEVRCFMDQKDYCKRYLAVDPNRSITLTDYSEKKLYRMFSFELQAPKPLEEDWGLYEQKELPYTFYYPLIGGIGVNGQFSRSSGEPITQIVEIISYATTTHQTNTSLANTILTRIETLAEKELDKLVSSRQSFLGVSSTTVRTVNGIPVTSLCYTDAQRKVCEYYYARPGQQIIRVTDYADQKSHTDLYFKYFYPYEPLQILEN